MENLYDDKHPSKPGSTAKFDDNRPITTCRSAPPPAAAARTCSAAIAPPLSLGAAGGGGVHLPI
jgi:hypothetical protein